MTTLDFAGLAFFALVACGMALGVRRFLRWIDRPEPPARIPLECEGQPGRRVRPSESDRG